MSILIKNGTIINADESLKADIRLGGGKIIEIGTALSASSEDEIIDATNKYLFPGGIDPHVHLHLPGKAGFSSDDFYTGSRAALFGGTTTFIDFVTPKKQQPLVEALNERKKESKTSIVDHTFHVSPIEWRETLEEEINACINEGITSFKIYLAYLDTIGVKDEDIRKIMKAVANAGGMITVHCELGQEIDQLRKSFIESDNTSPKFHPLSRPNYVESEAVKKVISMANETDCPLYIVHVSAKESLEHITKARKNGQIVFAETCPHYLLLDDSKYLGTFEETAPFVMSPPLRSVADTEALWEALSDSTIQTIGTDHCPFNMQQKRTGLYDFTKIPNGVGGIEYRLALIYTYGVLQNKIGLNRFVELISTQAAKIFGLFPDKGTIALGSDADLIIWNPEKEKIISSKTHHQNCDINVFEGFKIKGEAEIVIVGGNVLIKNGDLIHEEDV